MISYAPFWKTLEASSETTYTLRKKHNINGTTMTRLKHNLPVSTTTLNDLCIIFNCKLSDIAEFIPEEKSNI